MNSESNILVTPSKNKQNYLDSLKIFQLKNKYSNISLSNQKYEKENLFKEILTCKNENNKNIETEFIRYNNFGKKTPRNKHNKIMFSNEIRKISKRKITFSPLLIQKTKVHKKDVALAERLFLSSRYAFSNNINNDEYSINTPNYKNSTHNFFKLSKHSSCPKLNKSLNPHFVTERNEKIKDEIICKKEKKEIIKTFEKKYPKEKERKIEKKEINDLNEKEIILEKKEINNKVNTENEIIYKTEEKKENLELFNVKTLETSENNTKFDNKEYSINSKLSGRKLTKISSKKLINDLINHSIKSLSNSISLDKFNKIKKNDKINPEEQHFLCVKFQHKINVMNSLLN